MAGFFVIVVLVLLVYAVVYLAETDREADERKRQEARARQAELQAAAMRDLFDQAESIEREARWEMGVIARRTADALVQAHRQARQGGNHP